MLGRHFQTALLTAAFIATPLPAVEKVVPDQQPESIASDEIAEQVLKGIDLVLDTHIDPPTRQQMMLAGSIELLRKAPVPSGLSRQISDLQGHDATRAFLSGLFTSIRKDSPLSTADLKGQMYAGIFSTVSGSVYEPAEKWRVSQQLRANRYVGIGIKLGAKDDWPMILVPFPRGPAHLVGAKSNDLIIEIGDESTKGMQIAEVVERLRGHAGEEVTIAVRQPRRESPVRRLTIVRGEVPIETVTGYRRQTTGEWEYRPIPSLPIAYLRISSIGPSTVNELRKIASTLEPRGLRAVVLDLRHAQGGNADSSAMTADEFLAKGEIGRVRYANGVKEYTANADSRFAGLPMAVLIDPRTNSGAEFLAAALADNRRAITVGEQTAGIAFVHTALTLPGEAGGVLLRAGEYLRAGGRPLQGVHDKITASPLEAAQRRRPSRRPPGTERDGGVKPDHLVVVDDRVRLRWWNWTRQQERPEGTTEALPEDPQLQRALKVLQAAAKLL